MIFIIKFYDIWDKFDLIYTFYNQGWGSAPGFRPDTFPRTPVPKFRTTPLHEIWCGTENWRDCTANFTTGHEIPAFWDKNSAVPPRARCPETCPEAFSVTNGIGTKFCGTIPTCMSRGHVSWVRKLSHRTVPSYAYPWYNYVANIFALVMGMTITFGFFENKLLKNTHPKKFKNINTF